MSGKLFGGTAIITFVLIAILVILSEKSEKRNKKIRQECVRRLAELRNDLSTFVDITKYKFYPLFNCDPEDSYTQNKKNIYVCVSDKGGNIQSEYKIKDVLIHEISHAECSSIDVDHTSKEFLNTYNGLIKKAKKCGYIS